MLVIISHERRVLFVHVHRTGGTSIQKHLKETLFGAENLGPQHSSLIEAKRLIGPEFASYFKFAFVRNPWERADRRFPMRSHLDDAPPPELSGLRFEKVPSNHREWATLALQFRSRKLHSWKKKTAL